MKSTNKYTATDTDKTANHSSWNAIKEEPDEIDLPMLKEIETDPDCQEFTREDDITWN